MWCGHEKNIISDVTHHKSQNHDQMSIRFERKFDAMHIIYCVFSWLRFVVHVAIPVCVCGGKQVLL